MASASSRSPGRSVAGGVAFVPPRSLRAIALTCLEQDAPRLVYAKGDPPEATPIGITCRLCQRAECQARAAPPIGRDILTDEYRRHVQPFAFTES